MYETLRDLLLMLRVTFDQNEGVKILTLSYDSKESTLKYVFKAKVTRPSPDEDVLSEYEGLEETLYIDYTGEISCIHTNSYLEPQFQLRSNTVTTHQCMSKPLKKDTYMECDMLLYSLNDLAQQLKVDLRGVASILTDAVFENYNYHEYAPLNEDLKGEALDTFAKEFYFGKDKDNIKVLSKEEVYC